MCVCDVDAGVFLGRARVHVCVCGHIRGNSRARVSMGERGVEKKIRRT